MPVVVYLDETGDHSLEKEDPSFPVFALTMLVCASTEYCSQIMPAFHQLKFDYWGHEGVIFHSRDVRKWQGDFVVLADPARRQSFYTRLNDIMAQMPYRRIVSVIRKQAHTTRYGSYAENPYDLSLTFAMERLVPLLEAGQQHEVVIVAESRGKNEDYDLERTFLQFATYSTDYVSLERLRQLTLRLVFLPKSRNVIGTQMADLAGYPIARSVSDPSKPNPAYDVVKGKFYVGGGRVHGLKIFP